MKSLRTITVTILWFALLATGHALAQCSFDRAVAVGTGQTAVRGVAVAPDGSVIVSGTFEDSTRIGPIMLRRRLGIVESFLARYTADLELLWVIDMRGAREVQGVAVDSNGNIFAVGWGGGFVALDSSLVESQGGHDMFLAKVTLDGRIVWMRMFGGESNDIGRSVAVDGNGGAVVTGYSESSLMSVGDVTYPTRGGRDIVVIAVDSAGEPRWVRTAGGPGLDEGRGIAVGNDGSVYVTGEFDQYAWFGDTLVGSRQTWCALTARYDRDGTFSWVYAPNVPPYEPSEGHGVAVGTDGRVWTTGQFFGTLIDSDDTVRTRGNWDVMLMQLDTAGRLITMRGDGSPSIDQGTGVAVATDGSVYVSGRSEANRETAWFGNIAIKTKGPDAFIARYDAEGEPTCVKTGGDIWFDDAYAVAAGAKNTAYLVGAFTIRAGFDSILIVGDTTNPGTGFIARAHFDTESAVPAVSARAGLVVRQVVGARGTFVIDGLTDADADVRVFDLLGCELGSVRIMRNAGSATIDFGTVPPGAYIISVHGAGPLRSALVTVR